jgi:RHS repeat-associated protein
VRLFRVNQYKAVEPQGKQLDYHYDDNGNLTCDGFYKYYYDCENRLTDVNYVNNSRVASYKYDWLGRRVRKIVYGSPDEVTSYCYDGDQAIAEYDENGTLQRKFVYGAGIDESVAMYAVGSGWYYYHYDGLGSVIALSDSSGNIVEQCSYDIFGEPSCISGLGNPYKFTGRRYDAETGLYYYRERYYSPQLGRFLSPDPIGYEEGLNLYTYCGNNPINWLDPWGLCKADPEVLDEMKEDAKKVVDEEIARKGWPRYKHCDEYQDMLLMGDRRIERGNYKLRGILLDRGLWKHAVVGVYDINDMNNPVDIWDPWSPGVWPFRNLKPDWDLHHPRYVNPWVPDNDLNEPNY